MTEVFAIKVPQKLDKMLFEKLLEHVTPEKRARIKRFVREEDRLRGLFSDLLIRSVIIKKTGLQNESIRFGTNEYGKPFLLEREDIHFNISHSGIWVVAAVDTRPVGVDVEEIAPVDLSISEHYFSEEEHRDLMEKSDKLSYFFTLWTLKESYIKILGKGLSHPLNAFSVKYVDKDKISIKEGNEERNDIRFASYDLHEDYKTMLCATHDNLPEDVTMETADNLIQEFLFQ